MSNQTDGALRVLQWLGNMETRVNNLSHSKGGRQVPGNLPMRTCPRDYAKEWEQKVAHRKGAANKRLVKAIRAIPASNNRERMTLFVNYALKVAVHRQLEKFQAKLGLSVMPWVDMDLLGPVKEGQADWHGQVTDAYVAAMQHAAPFECLLGELFNVVVGAGQKSDCQHFTPWDMASAIPRLLPEGRTLTGDANVAPVTVMDPACGSGTLLLAQIQGHLRNGHNRPDALKNLVVMANDRDPLCAAMTALQLLMNQLVWERPIGLVNVECKDTITECLEPKPVFGTVIAHWTTESTTFKENPHDA